MEIRPYRSSDERLVLEIWERAGITRPWNDPKRDIERKVSYDPEGFFVACIEEQPIGTVMAGYDGHRGWIQYLAIDPAHQRQGVGRALVDAAIELLRARGSPKINLQVRRSNVAVVKFYESLGFREDDVLSMGLRLVVDE